MWASVVTVSLLLLTNYVYVSEAAAEGTLWGFTGDIGTANWKNMPGFSGCGATHQSPIDIDTTKVIYDKHLKPFHYYHYGESNYTITNKGQNFDISFGDTIWNASFDGYSGYCYKMLQMHFHWGKSNDVGSEHKLDGKQYPMEAHFVMWNCRDFPNATEAFTGVNGLAVVGLLFSLDNTKSNPVLEKIVQKLNSPHMRKCPCNGTNDYVSTTIPYFDINKLMPKNRNRFYRYKGSLTTPPCTENVLWSVFADSATVTQGQLDILRKLQNSDALVAKHSEIQMVNNYRPALPLNPEDPANAYRFVGSSFQIGASPTLFAANLKLVVISVLLLICNYSLK